METIERLGGTQPRRPAVDWILSNGRMFERITQTEADKDREAADLRSPEKAAALQLAAILLFSNVLLTIVLAIVLRVTNIPIISMVISLGLAYYLFKLRPRAEALALGLTILGAITQPLLLFMKLPPLDAAIQAIPLAGTIGAMFLLLLGEPTRARRAVAIALFAVLTCGFYGFAILDHLMK
jgi:hypothetical protein